MRQVGLGGRSGGLLRFGGGGRSEFFWAGSEVCSFSPTRPHALSR